MMKTSDSPKVSLIMTSYNCRENIKLTLKSVDTQDYQNIEIIIVDGESGDGTVEVIEEYSKHGKYPCNWISEKDKGLYDALNKGYYMATGDIIAVCNDLFVVSNAVSLMVNAIINNRADGAHADLIYATDSEVKRYWHMGEGRLQEGWMPGHPTLYLKREVYEKYGLYDVNYKCSADYEFMVRILKDRTIKLAYVPKTIIRMFYGGTSTAGIGSYWISVKEAYKALVSNGIKRPSWIVFRRTLRVLKQFAKAGKYNESFG